jgi:hypothetical protein
MATKWAFILLVALLVALAQKCESDIFDLERKQNSVFYDPSVLSQRLLLALKELGVNSETKPDELVAKIHEAAKKGNERADFHDIFQTLSSVIQEEVARCPYELFDLIEAFVGLRLRRWYGNDGWIVFAFKNSINGFLKAKIAPKLDECVKSVVETYAGREELDVLEPFDGFFEAAFGPDWPAKLPKFEFALSFDWIDVEKAVAFINQTGVAGFGGRRNPARKIKKFLDDKCERIQAFKDVASIELVNAIYCEGFPNYYANPPPDAQKELPEKLLKIKNYYRICVQWRYSHFEWTRLFTKHIAHTYDLMQGRWLARLREWHKERKEEESPR